NDEIESDESYDAISHATTELAEKIDADVIICQTSTGATAAAIAAQRPNLPIITVTSNPRVAGQLALTYANSAFVRPYTDNYGLELAQELKESGYLQKREGKDTLTAVIVSGIKSTAGGTNTIRIRNV
ncbi:pyruvate kinase, partial [Candidatus Saccharibacteria bacterium]|nr:pyruvate kinase [Candidatus Saccharibacteria bacterium]